MTKSFIFLFGILLLSGEVFSAERRSSGNFISIRALGLTRHIVDVTYNAEYFPLKLEQNAVHIFNPGILMGIDRPLNGKDLFWRTVQAIYIDCAIQPATYIGTMIFKEPLFKYQNVSVGFGFGFGAGIRRSWSKYSEPGIKTRFFKDWGAVEGIIGPYSEIELAFKINNRRQFVLNFIPAYPALVFLTVGYRLHV
ncbi:MAG: hypothetical protein Q7J65_06720 [Candidatus Marinimicrobia bacterium]|nr:hypothetical protein [Candidatus Neomarinimicrobiota bacterium]